MPVPPTHPPSNPHTLTPTHPHTHTPKPLFLITYTIIHYGMPNGTAHFYSSYFIEGATEKVYKFDTPVLRETST